MPVGWLSGAGQGEASPHIGEGGDQRVDIRVAVQRCGGQAQPFRAAWHRGVVDRLDIDPVALQQLEASRDYLFTAAGIPQDLFSSQ